MLVFLSWSGHRSKAVALALESWLSQVIQAVEPWISTDIEKGLRWSPEISLNLELSKVGIVCLTPENLKAPWVLFEAGAISKTKDAHVCTLLFDLESANVEQPLGQFQHTRAVKADVWELVKTVNNKLEKAEEKGLKESVLEKAFEKYWPDLESKLAEIKELPTPQTEKIRPDRELLEEILEILRRQERRSVMMPEVEIEHEAFDCPKMGDVVRITREILIHRRGGVVDARTPRSFDCNSKSECGVGTEHGSGISFDWEKCEHPQRKR
jgi:hypothetical protein